MNKLHCITIKNDFSIEKKFEEYCYTFLDSDDGDYLTGGDNNDDTIYLTYLNKDKINKMIEFFEKHNLLINYEII